MASSVTRSSDSASRTSSAVSRTSGATSQASGATSRTSIVDRSATSPRAATGHTERSSFTATSRTSPAASTGSLRPGARGESVRSLQDKLKASGFDPGRSDGIFGPRTERAVRDFQRSQGLQVDGIAGRRTSAALNGTDGMAGNRPGTNGVNGTARLNNQPDGRGMTTGSITVNGRSYQFNSGSGSRFSTPEGTYRVTAHRNSRSEAAFVRDGVGFSFRMEDARRPNSDAMYDSRAGRDRTALRIHPDGGARGTAGCIGIVGDAATMRQFRDDMNAELRRNGGSYTLRVQ
ncbi:peptidoglycan-binding domain-containing protein [Stigmatella sp. ncwal1]|uniref:Peptidoglycan-binding domain-containing protein n=1 Tax=Stigmatella ashevillensis TaxID=2995309 RepID=A0ABT5DFD6_9BACT|nr:peptidoglycan-binding domain-containing protein [Stigmatella ashevillena]MDC0712377.1 peptidoglycan-binding domain-containing protein [Stigmatella ashevillena]